MRTQALPAAPLALSALLLLLGCAGTAGGPGKDRARSRSRLDPYTQEGPLPGAVRVDFELPKAAAPTAPAAPAAPVASDGSKRSAFYSLPWPSELLRAPDGSIDWSAFPGRERSLIAGYVTEASASARGFSVATSAYFHFSGAPDQARIPARPADTMAITSPVFLMDVDPASPERGALVPLEVRYYPSALRYVPRSTLAVKPLAGFVLRPGTLYAAAVRRDLGDASGAPLGTSASLEAIKWTAPRADPIEERARLLHTSALDFIEERGALRDDIAAVALFRTDVPHAVAEKLFEVATSLPKELSPRIVKVEWEEQPSAFYRTIRGYYCTPNFQSDIDAAPFFGGGGALSLDEAGRPRVVEIPEGSRYRTDACGGLIRARFFLTIPKEAPMPASGFPLLVTGHGTGGNARSFLGDDNFAGWAARAGIAAVSTDQPLHGSGDPLGARPGARDPRSLSLAELPWRLFRGQNMGAELAFYNPMNAGATRDNLRQAGVDASLLARVLVETDFAAVAPPAPGAKRGAPLLRPIKGREAPRFDRDRILFAGHSQGSQAAAVQAAIDPLARGVLLSGCGGDARLGILRRKDLAFMPVIERLLEVAPGELSEHHPFMTLVQTLIDPVDPQSYGRLYREPLPGRRPQNVLHYGGIVDTYSPPATAGALAVAMRATPLHPLVDPVRGLSLLGLSAAEGVVRGNAGGGQATIAFVQLAATYGEDGHFVLFAEPGAPELAIQFMQSAAAPGGGPAEVGPLQTAPRSF
jgi:hypothetical protein